MNTMKRICGPLGPGLEYWSIPVWPCHMSSSVVLDHEIIAVWMKFRYLKERQARGTLFCGYAFESLSAGQAVCRHEQDPFFLIFFYREGHLFLAHFVGRCAAVAFSCCFSWTYYAAMRQRIYEKQTRTVEHLKVQTWHLGPLALIPKRPLKIAKMEPWNVETCAFKRGNSGVGSVENEYL